MTRRWYLADSTRVHWPGVLPWRGAESALAGRGYATENEARARAYRIACHYAAKHSCGGPDLMARELHAITIETE